MLPSLFLFKCSEVLCCRSCTGAAVHGGWHRNFSVPSCYREHEMICIQASLLVEELVAAGCLLFSVGFIGIKGLGEASCHVGMPARGCA